MPARRTTPLAASLLLAALACTDDGGTMPPPPPPSGVPLVLGVSPVMHSVTAQVGTTAPTDSATITVTGDGAASLGWTATKRLGRTTLVTASGSGSGTVRWQRSLAGLAVGLTVDTITITAPGATGSPFTLYDTLRLTAAPVPLSLALAPTHRGSTVVQGGALPADSTFVTIAGTGATALPWAATKMSGWLSLPVAAGIGSGWLTWTRAVGGLAVGTYVDTITVTAAGASGSPARFIDTVVVTAAPVPLALDLAPRGRATSITAGNSAGSDSATVALTGDGAASAAWSAAKAQSWTVFTTSSGAGNGKVRWTRNTQNLGVGTWVDTITVSAVGASGSPVRLFDTVRVAAAPSPLTLAVTPRGRSTTITAGGSVGADSATITFTGDGAGTAAWTATKKQAWTTLTTAAGNGNGKVRWTRATTTLAAGTWVDTITVTAAGAAGSPITIHDTIVVNATTPGGTRPDLGLNASLHGKRIFPENDPWNRRVDADPVDPNSTAILSRIGLTRGIHPDFGADEGNGQPFGIPYIVVPDDQPRKTVRFDYDDESDPGPYPIPPNPPIEPAGDQHLLVITRDAWILWELYLLEPAAGDTWDAGSGAIFNMTTGTQRPAGWTSADAAGLPVLPGLVRYDEVYETGQINHAIRFTVRNTRRAYIPPATHWASSSTDPLNLPMGARVRLKASFDISGYPAPMQVILRAMKQYGMIVADNGSDFFFTGTADARWNDAVNNTLKQVKVGDFEVIQMTGVVQ